jgi:acyl-[acyl-carrier-protein]-phospholipid O-acyltransferase/long-chain-fatty-acid--[acyl-carrier-protein] ligase
MTAPFANKPPQTTSATVKINEPPRPNLRIAPLENPTGHDSLPKLYGDSSFWGMAATQFFGAFNDNLFKQLVLLLSISATGLLGVPALAAALIVGPVLSMSGTAAVGPLLMVLAITSIGESDSQGLAMFVFAAPFLAFTGYAGYLADKLSKRTIVVACKVAEIGVMALGAMAFVSYETKGSLWPLYCVLFLMGTHSAFFGPAKYGILPEMLRPSDLPRANGLLLMSTFLAIIFGTVVAGVLLKFFGDRLWVASLSCMSIAVIGTISAMWVRRVPPANPHLKFELAAITVPHDMRKLLSNDQPLSAALIVSSMFWLLAGMVPAAVNALGKIDMELDYAYTSVLTGAIGIGIALGCVIGGLVSRGQVDFKLVRAGSVGMLVCLLVLALPAHLLGFAGSLPVMLALGAFTGLFAVPLQVFMQCRPPDDKKGRMIAVMNQANWVGIIVSAGLYQALAQLIEGFHWPRSVMFVFIALLMLPIALFYHPKNEQLPDTAPA